jgi:uncharacterized protein (DUF2235 family)
MKRLVVCLDGTWQRLTQPDPTNIAKIATSVAHSDANGVSQIVFYDAGVGALSITDKKPAKPLIAGITGEGLDDNLTDAYQFLSWNYTTGDEIYIFGFSRGAFTARSLCGLIRNAGLLHRPHIELTNQAYVHYRSKHLPDCDEACEFRTKYSYDPIPIAYIGLFDTVGQLGVPSNFGPLAYFLNGHLKFHDLSLSGRVKSARQACAIDEDRAVFPLTPWENLDERNRDAGFRSDDPDAPYQQRWFPGGHGEVGGGTGSQLSNIPLRWIAEGAERAGLMFTPDDCPLSRCTTPENIDPLAAWTRPTGFLNLAGKKARNLRKILGNKNPSDEDANMVLTDAAVTRWRAENLDPPYRPKSLKVLSRFIDGDE